MISVSVAVEGRCDEPVIRRILVDHEIDVTVVLGGKGKGFLDSRMHGFNKAAKHSRWLVLRDLDRDAECPGGLARSLLPVPEKLMTLRIAVRAIEAWLLADSEGIVSFFRVKAHDVPANPEGLSDPKRTLVDVASKSRLRAMRDDMVPAVGTTAPVGPGYVGRIIEFAATEWSWKRAARRSRSLHRCVDRIAKWHS